MFLLDGNEILASTISLTKSEVRSLLHGHLLPPAGREPSAAVRSSEGRRSGRDLSEILCKLGSMGFGAFNVATNKRDKARLRRLAQQKALCHLGYRKLDYCKRYLLAKEMCPNLSDT